MVVKLEKITKESLDMGVMRGAAELYSCSRNSETRESKHRTMNSHPPDGLQRDVDACMYYTKILATTTTTGWNLDIAPRQRMICH